MSRYGPPPQNDYPQPPPRYYNQPRERETDYHAPELDRCRPVGYMRSGEQVEVRIRGNMWVVGLLVSSLHLVSSYLGHGYDVEYKDQRNGQAFRETFRAEDVRPFAR